jgi:dTDP-4-dehydrorhamnose 3,5-epimerase-like enzyme
LTSASSRISIAVRPRAFCARCIAKTPNPQGKLVRVVSEAAFDVAVDLSRASPTVGAWAGVTLTVANNLLI